MESSLSTANSKISTLESSLEGLTNIIKTVFSTSGSGTLKNCTQKTFYIAEPGTYKIGVYDDRSDGGDCTVTVLVDGETVISSADTDDKWTYWTGKVSESIKILPDYYDEDSSASIIKYTYERTGD